MRSFFLLGFLIFSNFIWMKAQSRNLELIHELIDSSAVSIFNSTGKTEDPLKITFNYGENYNSLTERFIIALTSLGAKLTKSELIGKTVSYSIDEASINYSEVFKDGLFGSYKVERRANLSGSFIFTVNNKVEIAQEFSISTTDTVDYDSISELENPSLSFTRSKIPAEPLLPTLIEPAIAISSIAITIILFFTVRSK